ncbi:MAG TPA: GyrI-like domain-containing protein [Saprospiraceae bacterium]|nr:GyrI-like domain-containing protein [Saprospiraceae bacterium]
MNATVNVMDLTPIKLVFVSHIGIDGLDDAFSRIFEWASLKELTNGDNVEFVRIYNDSFKITSPNKVRMEIGIPVHQKVTPDSGIQFKEFEPRRCIVGNFEINLPDFEKAWSSLFIWMNENGYKPGKQRPFEIIKNNFNKHPQKKCIVDLYIPVE